MRGLKQFVTKRLPVLPAELTSALGFPASGADAVRSKVKFIRRAACGLSWIYICLDNVASVESINVGLGPLRAWGDLLNQSMDEEDKQGRWLNGISVFSVDKAEDGNLKIYARVILEENGSLVEDPATGSAALG